MNGVMVLGSSESTSYTLRDEYRPLLSKESGVGEMQVKEEEKSSCFTHTCQDYACISFLFLVGAALLAAGIALCVLGLTFYLGGILVVLGGLLLVVALSSTFFLCKEYCEHEKIIALEAAIEKKEQEYDKMVEKCSSWSNIRGDAHDVWRDHCLRETYQDLCALYNKRDSIEQCNAR